MFSAQHSICIFILSFFNFCHGQQVEGCGGPLDASEYLINNPGYPTATNPESKYPPNLDCEWYYEGYGDSTLVSLKFWDMVIEIGDNGSNVTCDYDYLNVTIESLGEPKRFCGNAAPPDIIKGVGKLTIFFHSDASVNYRGFQATYTINNEFNPCDPDPCDKGACGRTEDKMKPKCNCYPGATGENCDVDIRECLSQPCMNGATCDDTSVLNVYTCQCMARWEGVNCEAEKDSPCLSEPCVNDGNCSVLESFDYQCDCQPTYEGINCEIVTGCGNPGIAYLEEGKRFFEDSTLDFSCEDGFVVVGSANITCMADGSWSSDLPECINNLTLIARESNALSPWSCAMVVLGVALSCNIVIFTLWMVYRGPCVELEQDFSKVNAIKEIKSVCSTVSMMNDDVFEDEDHDDHDEEETDSSASYQQSYRDDVP